MISERSSSVCIDIFDSKEISFIVKKCEKFRSVRLFGVLKLFFKEESLITQLKKIESILFEIY